MIRICVLAIGLGCFAICGPATSGQESHQSIVDAVQPKMVKLNGSGGFRGLESYQSGFLISSEGHILTVWKK